MIESHLVRSHFWFPIFEKLEKKQDRRLFTVCYGGPMFSMQAGNGSTRPCQHATCSYCHSSLDHKEHGHSSPRHRSFVQTSFHPAHKGVQRSHPLPPCWVQSTHVYYDLVCDIYSGCERLYDFWVRLFLEPRTRSQN